MGAKNIISMRENRGSTKYRERGGQQKEITTQRVEITIVGDSQQKRLDETKLSSHHYQFKTVARGGYRIGHATQQVGKSDSDIILVHAGTNDIKSRNVEELSDEIINTLNNIQDSNPSLQIAHSSMFRRNDYPGYQTLSKRKLRSQSQFSFRESLLPRVRNGKNDPTPNRKVAEANKILEEKHNLHGFDPISVDPISVGFY